ncbi:MAG: hypothetical protein LUG52_07565 [Clostridia bacterium]|nr:hypothetical protein [Clostridia bacterium]
MKRLKINKPKGLFMKCVVVFCIAYVVHIIEYGLRICEEDSLSPNTIVTAAIAFFGSELIICMVKRIWAKEDGAKTEAETETAEKPKEIKRDC